MQRTQISLSDHERALLDAEAARTGRSISALIRDAVTAVYSRQRTVEDDLAAMRTAFGQWSTDGPDGASWVERRRTGARLSSVVDT